MATPERHLKRTTTMAECELCSDPSQVPDLVPGQAATCPSCGRRVFAPAPARPQEAIAMGPARTVTAVRPECREPRPAAALTEVPVEKPAAPASFIEGLRKLNVGTAAAFICGSVALLLASIPPLDLVTKPLAGLGVVIGLLAGVLPAWMKDKPLSLPIAICALCMIALTFAGRSLFSRAASMPASVAIALNADPKTMAAHKPVAEGAWVDASVNAMQTNGLRVHVVAVRVAHAELKQQQKKVLSPEKHVLIHLRTSYHGGAFQHLPYASWADSAATLSQHAPTLTDSSKRTYAQVTFDAGRTVIGRPDYPLLTYGHALDEVLVFPAAAAQTDYLRLTLPASAFGVAGDLRFQIPRSMIKTS
jgi:hypothetical protein